MYKITSNYVGIHFYLIFFCRGTSVTKEHRQLFSFTSVLSTWFCVTIFSCIFNKDSVSHCIMNAVSLDPQVLDAVQRGASIEATIDCIVSNVRLGYSSDHVVVNWVFSKQEGLTNGIKLQVFDPPNYQLVTRGVDHDLGTKLGLF